MKDSRDKIYLERILASIKWVDWYIVGFKYKYFERDRKTYDAVLMQLINIGEMINRFSESFSEKHNDLPWHQIIGMRNQIAHGYFEIDPKEVWNTATKDLPKLKKQIKDILKDYK